MSLNANNLKMDKNAYGAARTGGGNRPFQMIGEARGFYVSNGEGGFTPVEPFVNAKGANTPSTADDKQRYNTYVSSLVKQGLYMKVVAKSPYPDSKAEGKVWMVNVPDNEKVREEARLSRRIPGLTAVSKGQLIDATPTVIHDHAAVALEGVVRRPLKDHVGTEDAPYVADAAYLNVRGSFEENPLITNPIVGFATVVGTKVLHHRVENAEVIKDGGLGDKLDTLAKDGMENAMRTGATVALILPDDAGVVTMPLSFTSYSKENGLSYVSGDAAVENFIKRAGDEHGKVIRDAMEKAEFAIVLPYDEYGFTKYRKGPESLGAPSEKYVELLRDKPAVGGLFNISQGIVTNVTMIAAKDPMILAAEHLGLIERPNRSQAQTSDQSDDDAVETMHTESNATSESAAEDFGLNYDD
jgi:hypothetical protein